MKRLVICMFLIIQFNLFSQNLIDPDAIYFSINQTSVRLSPTLYPQNNYIIGWQWGDMPRTTYEISSNMSMDPKTPPQNPVWTSPFINLVERPSFHLINAASFQYEPTLYIPTASRGQFIVKQNDPLHSIFGFSVVRGDTPTSGVNSSRLVLNDESLVTLNNGIVLDNPWMNNELRRLEYDKDNVLKPYNGKDWYITINLRRLNNTDITDDNTPLLEIRLPYKLANGNTGFIRFDSIPLVTSTPVNIRGDYQSPDYRGITYNLEEPANELFVFQITRNMIPKGDATERDITLSAHFSCDSSLLDWDEGKGNYTLKYRNAEGLPFEIDTLGIQVKYLTNATPLAIDWIRIENGSARNTYRGLYDAQCSTSVQQIISDYENSNTYKFFRLYSQGGDDGAVIWNWGIMRYQNKLYGGITVSSIPNTFSKHQQYYIESAEKWTPSPNVKAFSGWMSSPYYKAAFKTNNLDTTYGFHYYGGYLTNENYWPNSNCSTCIRADPLNSSWETYSTVINSSYPLQTSDNTFLSDLKNLNTTEYLHHLNEHMHSLQAKWEYFIIDKIYKNSYFLYSEQPWWAQLFVVSNWGARKLDSNVNLSYFNRVYDKYGFTKPKTGEETRLQSWTALIYGAKGLIYDRQFSYDILPEDPTTQTNEAKFAACGITDNGVNSVNVDAIPSDTTGLDFLRSPRLGGDFLTEKEATNLPLYMDTSLLKQYLNVPDGRIYMGRLSQRLELQKVHSLVKATESTLMRLRLACWLGKSFKKWYHQDTARFGSTNLLTKFIDTNRTKLYTKKLFSVNPSTMEYVPQISPEGYDSMFTDITILRDTSNNEMDKYFILGIQNRRTDPLVLWDWDSAGTKKHYMRFLSTAEFEDFCHTGADTLKFQDLYWKRLGCREFHIPFKFRNSNKSNDWTTLRVTELGYDDTTLNKQPWRDKKYY